MMLHLRWLAFLAVVCLSAPASAQSVRLDQYRMAETPSDGFSLSRPNAIGHLAFGVRLDVDYALNPLVYQTRRSDSSTELSPIVEHLFAGQLGLSFGLFDRLIIFAGLPVNFVLDGNLITGQPRADGTTLGDLSFGLRGRLFGEDDEAFALALQVTGTAPTAQAARFQSRFAGEGDWTIHPELLFEIRIAEIVRITANLGALVRDEQDFGSLRVGHEFTWGGALAIAVVADTLDLTIESWGSTALDSRFAEAQVSPIELVGGLRVYPVEGLAIGAVAGTGVARGYGAGDFRAVLSVGYQTPGEQPPGDRDEDGITDDVDECPDEPEDIDEFEDDNGCPDPDNDADGIPDAPDECPNEAEDMDGLGDEDGCPELDFDEDGAADEEDRCPRVPGVALAPRPECTGCPTCDDEAPPPEPEPEPVPQMATTSASLAPRVLFEAASPVLRPSQLRALTEILQYLESQPGTQIVVEGHADFRGSEAANLLLSRQRARRVMQWLRWRGIDPQRMTGAGCGEAHPEAGNDTRPGRRANRRVEFRAFGSGSILRGGCTETHLPR